MSSINPEFEKFFSEIYKDRWPNILAALQVKNQQTKRKNLFFEPDKNLSEFYLMDPASELVARAVEATSEDRVLDLCAAPGGKTLILAESMSFVDGEPTKPEAELISNEMS